MSKTEQLYTAKQAGAICGLDSVSLQIALDRGHLRATSVPQGNRTYRLFTRQQLLSVWVFARMSELGIKPAAAQFFLEEIEHELPLLHFRSGLKYIVFRDPSGAVFFVQHGESLEKVLCGGGYVLDYEGTVAHLDNEIKLLPHLDRWIERQEEKARKK